jgi:hypothetical protein
MAGAHPLCVVRGEGDVAMFGFRRRLGAALCGVLWCTAGAAAPDASAATAASARPAGDAGLVARWVAARDDHRGRPYAVVDKRGARIYVFEPSGSLIGAAPVLLGLAMGDRDAVGNLGQRSVASLLPAERTTPSGRFETEPGRNDKGEAIVWLQYDAALAIHRLRPAPLHERRPERLASPDPAERRITFGCVVVPVEFYEAVIQPTLGVRRGVVYVLPEAGPVEALLRNTDTALHTP